MSTLELISDLHAEALQGGGSRSRDRGRRSRGSRRSLQGAFAVNYGRNYSTDSATASGGSMATSGMNSQGNIGVILLGQDA
jgi:hypothetical protein